MTSSLVVDITPLKRQPDTPRSVELRWPAPDDLGLASAEIRAVEIGIDLQLEIAGDQLIAQGAIDIDWRGPCRRCLEDQTDTTPVEIREIFQKVPIEGETYHLDEDDVDLEPMVRETVLLNLPVAPLCRQDCAGPDPERFPTSVVQDPDPDEPPPADPRWGALSELKFDD